MSGFDRGEHLQALDYLLSYKFRCHVVHFANKELVIHASLPSLSLGDLDIFQFVFSIIWCLEVAFRPPDSTHFLSSFLSFLSSRKC